MNLSKSSNVPPAVASQSNGPKFQNKNLNYVRNPQPFSGSKSGVPPKSGVQVIQAKQKLGKAVGAAAVPAAPTPMNTPSLKRETASNLSSNSWNGQGSQSNDDASPSLKGLSAPAKPAPWAKPGNSNNATVSTEAEKTEEQKVESTSKQGRSWANADDSEDEDRQEPQETDWPDNFREPVEELPPANQEYSDYDHQHKYIPPYGRKLPAPNKFERQEGYHDTKYGSQQQWTQNKSNQYQSRRPEHYQNPRFETDVRPYRNNRESLGFSDTPKGRYANDIRSDEDSEHVMDNRVSARFVDSYDRFIPRQTGGDDYSRSRPLQPDSFEGRFEKRGFDHYSESRASTRLSDQTQNRRAQGAHRFGEGEERGYKERSRTMSEEFDPVTSVGRAHIKTQGDSYQPDEIDLNDIENSRREAEYLEVNRLKLLEKKTEPSQEQRYSSTVHSSKPSEPMNSRAGALYSRGPERLVDHRPNAASIHTREDHRWERVRQMDHQNENRTTDPPSHPYQRIETTDLRKENRTLDSGSSGAYKGQDSVRLNFPRSQQEQDSVEDLNFHVRHSQGTSHHSQYEAAVPESSGNVNTNRDYPIRQFTISQHQSKVLHDSVDHEQVDRRLPVQTRQKLLYDPQSNQLIVEDTQSFKSKMPKDSNEQEKNDSSSRRENETKPAENDRQAPVDERKILRQRERTQRLPRTKGFLYKFTEKGDVERVLFDWEKDADSSDDLREIISRDTANGSGPSWNNALDTSKEFKSKLDPKMKNKDNKKVDSTKSEDPHQGGVDQKPMISQIDNRSNALLGQFMPSSLFGTWNSDNQGPSLANESRMSWLTSPNSRASGLETSNQPIPGLSSLGPGFAGIMGSNPAPSLFSNSTQDWPYTNLLNESQAPSLQFHAALNEVGRPPTFSQFGGLLTNLEESVIMQPDKKDHSLTSLGKEESAPSKYFQREWQRFQPTINNNGHTKQLKPTNKELQLENLENVQAVQSVVNEALNERDIKPQELIQKIPSLDQPTTEEIRNGRRPPKADFRRSMETETESRKHGSVGHHFTSGRGRGRDSRQFATSSYPQRNTDLNNNERDSEREVHLSDNLSQGKVGETDRAPREFNLNRNPLPQREKDQQQRRYQPSPVSVSNNNSNPANRNRYGNNLPGRGGRGPRAHSEVQTPSNSNK